MSSRQVQLRCGATIVDLNTAPYTVLAPGWTSSGAALEIAVMVQAATLSELERYVATLHRMGTLAGQYDGLLLGDRVEVWQKTCDAIATTAELGATWLRKRLKTMTVLCPDPAVSADGQYKVRVTLSCEVSETWRRAAPASVIEVAAASDVTVNSDGSLTVAASKTLTARRISWTSGISIRYRWSKLNVNVDFFAVPGTTLKCWWDSAASKFKITDAAGNVMESSVQSLSGEVDVTFVLNNVNQGVILLAQIIVNGVSMASGVLTTFATAETYTILTPSAANTIYSCQVWPLVLTAVQAIELYVWGRPEPELPVVVVPADTKNLNCLYGLYNMPGEAAGGLRVLAVAGANEDQVRLALRPLRIPPALRLECESGTLGADTASAADADASGGNVAQFTPAATSWATRVTATLVATPADLAAMLGEYRLFLACKDAATNVNVNLVKFRVVVAGVAGDWSTPVGCAVVATRSLVELGTFDLAPGHWPEESERASTTGYGSAYVTIELQVANSVGSGGGALDLDALFCAPREAEGVASCTAWVAASQTAVLDWTGETPAGILAYDGRSLEFGGWADWVGHDMTLAPAAEAGVLWGWAYRDSAEQGWPADTLDLQLYFEPRWRR